MPNTKSKMEASTIALDETGMNSCVNHQTLQYPSAQQESDEFSGTSDTNLKRKAVQTIRDPAEKKKMSNKRDKKDTKTSLDILTEENNHLKEENNSLKMKGVQIKKTLQSGQEEMKHLQTDFAQLKDKLDSQNTVAELLSEQLAKSNDDLQRENAQLKHQIDLLMYEINNPENSDMIQLQRRKAQLEYERMVLQLTVEALCEKINNDEDDE